ncbi:MAG: GAF domain-containing protein [Firmicutes bacterium]|nr:GAF domain-containing protein [Bacillota bacterium]
MNQGAFYQELLTIYQALIAGEDNWLANMANLSAVLFDQMDEINWAGFYLWDGQELVLGPFQGKPACVRIPKGKGVCGTAVERAEPILVPDVHRFPGHIACDAASRSEVVIPFWHSERLIGVLDIDSPVLERFDQQDAEGLSRLLDALVAGSNWPDA